jgi:hypothetical protein
MPVQILITFVKPKLNFMSRSIFIFIFISSSLFLRAQDTLTCGFETLFTLKAGMSKPEVIDLINRNYPSNLVHTQIEKLPPYKGSGGDSIVKETFSYKRDITPCFKGHNTLLQLEFADNVLYKAYISTEFPKTAYGDMISNYNFLRNVIKAKWIQEKGIKLSSGNILGFGYDYTKAKIPNQKIEKVTLQYVDRATNNPKVDYLLEVLWINLKNTRMESSNY